jgi:hypothetical protein
MPIRLLYLMFARICAWLVPLGRPNGVQEEIEEADEHDRRG